MVDQNYLHGCYCLLPTVYFYKMNFEETVSFLYARTPVFDRVGASAYKPDLLNIISLLDILDHPENKFKTIHIAGTNGKGSSSHMLASILQTADFKTGLYTSPHLKSFTERIRINGLEVSEEFVVDFVNRIQPHIETIQPSFFEITTAMAFDYFAQQQVDIAVIEVGLGGRLDSTNVITPLISLITNISFDHKDLLGDTLEKIATEKAGIIKKGIPVVISEKQDNIAPVFIRKAKELAAPIFFASPGISAKIEGQRLNIIGRTAVSYEVHPFPLTGVYQEKNIPGVMKVVELLNKSYPETINISGDAIIDGLMNVVVNTRLKGRWQTIGEKPLTICDTGHNEAGIELILNQLKREQYKKLFVVFGMVKDKDISGVLKLLPLQATYFFCEAKIPRALPASQLKQQAAIFGLKGEVIPDVNEAIARARNIASKDDMIFVGGSTFVVAELDNL